MHKRKTIITICKATILAIMFVVELVASILGFMDNELPIFEVVLASSTLVASLLYFCSIKIHHHDMFAVIADCCGFVVSSIGTAILVLSKVNIIELANLSYLLELIAAMPMIVAVVLFIYIVRFKRKYGISCIVFLSVSSLLLLGSAITRLVCLPLESHNTVFILSMVSLFGTAILSPSFAIIYLLEERK